jgi:hypothetical protein
MYEQIPLLYSILSEIRPVTGFKGPAIDVHAILPPSGFFGFAYLPARPYTGLSVGFGTSYK